MAEARSEQSRDLSRRIRNGIIKQWAIFTAAFIVVAALFNAALAPRLGDWIADSTSDWHMVHASTYSTKEILDEMGFRNEDGTYDLWKLGQSDEEDVLLDYDAATLSHMSIDFDILSKYGEFFTLMNALETEGRYTFQTSATPGHEEYIVVVRDYDPSGREAVSIVTDGAFYTYTSFEEVLATPYFGFMDMEEAAYAFRMYNIIEAVEKRLSEQNLRMRYLDSIVNHQLPLSGNRLDWQTIPNFDEETLSYRDLSVYNFFRGLKVPVLLVFYFAGCAIIVFSALRRSLRSFDALSGAVGDIIANREEPVELPSDLSSVQDKLNNIRLTALADERAAVAAERRKDELVAYLAHDVKTPLTSVIGYLSLLDEAPDLPAEPREKYTRIAFEKACRLEGLIDEFFEITRYNLQAIPIERAWVQVKLFCEQVAEGFYVEAEARSLSIEVEAPDDARFFVDAEKLSRAVGNVVRNAIAYADPDTTIRLRAEAAEGESEPVWKLSVTDRGREISQAHLKSIFDKFYREDGARGTKEGGTGLGLAIAQEIVVAHKGAITAESEEGTTTFTITLPRLDDPLESTP